MDYYNSQLNAIAHDLPLYVAPNIYTALCMRKKQMAKYSVVKSIAFSFGLVLLELGILQSVQSIYDKEKKEINKMNLNHLIGQFEQRYDRSPWLVDSVKKLLEIDESERLDLKTLKETLPDRMIVDQWNRKLRHEKKMAIDGYNNPHDVEYYDNQQEE